jgi:hypothetical protein
MATARNTSEPRKPRRPPATTLEARENQLIAQAVDLAEKQISEGTASAAVLTHFLKLGTTREKLEQERLRRENLLLETKAKTMESGQRSEEMYAEALKAMRQYAGQDVEDEDDEE